MVAEDIEVIGINSRLIRTLETFTHLDIEDFKTQSACGFAIFNALRQAQPVAANFSMNVRLDRSGRKIRKGYCWWRIHRRGGLG